LPEQCTSCLCHPLCIYSSYNNIKKWCSFDSGLSVTCIFLYIGSSLFFLWYSCWLFINLFCVCVCVYMCRFWRRIFNIFLMRNLFCWLINIYVVLEVTVVISWLHIENFCCNCD
jgi:hypothetical protein